MKIDLFTVNPPQPGSWGDGSSAPACLCGLGEHAMKTVRAGEAAGGDAESTDRCVLE